MGKFRKIFFCLFMGVVMGYTNNYGFAAELDIGEAHTVFKESEDSSIMEDSSEIPETENFSESLEKMEEYSDNGSEVETFSSNVPSIQYQTHIQNIGWQNFVSNGDTSGTSGKALRLESIRVKINNSSISGGVEYKTHVQNIGWQGFVRDNQESGTSRKALRLEALQIKLTGELSRQYDVYYRVHSQNFGWQGWAKNGASSGTQGYAYRLEAVQIRLIKKGSTAPGPSTNAFNVKAATVNYRTHIQNQGWQGWKKDGVMSGTSKKALRLEAIQINLNDQTISGGIEYRTHVQNVGWQGWKKDNELSGTAGKALRLEAIQIRLIGEISRQYDIYYRVHAENFGWLDWTKNGNSSGTEGYGYRLEGIEIQLIKKGQNISGKTKTSFSDLKWNKGVNEAEKEIAKSVNVLRHGKGEKPLTWNVRLHQATKKRAQELKTLFSHSRPNGSSYDTVLSEVGYPHPCGENIVMSTGYSFKNDKELGRFYYKAWHDSPGHYYNMIGNDYKEMGIGVYKSGNSIYGVQLFGTDW
ncbi:CAP domain-containing protein [Enterococcus gilvus]|uniref:CAP domain-containing protein n=1 Tax=Enterococcus gilvus TaxID=160453 RepID=UPI00345EBD74